MSKSFIPFIYKKVGYLQSNGYKKISFQNSELFFLESSGNFSANTLAYFYYKDTNKSNLLFNHPVLIVYDHNNPEIKIPNFFHDLREHYSRLLIYSLDGKVLCYSNITNSFYFKIREEIDENNLVIFYPITTDYNFFKSLT